jgi:tetratricopeptide (TPR) repeat protein
MPLRLCFCGSLALLGLILVSSSVGSQTLDLQVRKSRDVLHGRASKQGQVIFLKEDNCNPDVGGVPESKPRIAGQAMPADTRVRLAAGPDLFCRDDSLANSASWQVQADGTIKMLEITRSLGFDPHNQQAWQFMQEGSNMERKAITDRNKGDIDSHDRWHKSALERFALAKNELESHLKAITYGESHQLVFYTLLNLADCCALLGQTDQALDYYKQYLQNRQGYWMLPYSDFKLACILMTESKGDKELSAARELLLQTTGTERGEHCWNTFNNDPEYRVISWYLLAEIEKRRGNLAASQQASRKAEEILKPFGQSLTQGGHETSGEFVARKLREVLEYGFI